MIKTRSFIIKCFEKVKENYSYIFSILLIFVTIFVIYGRDLQILANEALNNDAYTHILLVPFFVGYLFYLKRNAVKASVELERTRRRGKLKLVDEVIGVVLCLIAFLIYWYGSHTFYSLEYHIFSIPLFIMGVALIIFNLRTTLILLFPIFFLFFLVPPPMELLYSAGGFMANFETQAAYLTLKTLGLPVRLSSTYGPPIIQLLTTSTGESTHFAVDLPCSGLYSLMAFIMFATFLAFIVKGSILRKLLIFPIGFFIFEVLNIARITTIVTMAYFLGEEIAMTFFHSAAGLILIFIGMLLILVIAERTIKIKLSPKFQQVRCPKCEVSLKNNEVFCINCGNFLNFSHSRVSSKTLAKLLILLLGCTLLTLFVNAPAFAIAKNSISIRSGGTFQNSTGVLPEMEGYRLNFLYRDINYEKIAGQDAALIYAYLSTNYSKPTIFVSINVANSLSNLHSWEVCLVTWQTAHGRYPLVNVLNSEDIQLLEDPPITARYLAFRTPQNYTQLTLYWFERAPFDTGITIEQKYVRISLIIIVYEKQLNYGELKSELLRFGENIASYWEPLKTGSLISLGVSAIQLLLIFLTLFAFFVKSSQYIYETRRKQRNLKIFKGFASKEDKLILEAVSNLAKEKKDVETGQIAHALRKRGKFIKMSALVDKLKVLEEYGLVKREILSIDNNPKLVWKICSY